METPARPHLGVIVHVWLEGPDVIHLDVAGASSMLRAFGAASDIEVLPDGGTVLDSAGEYRYPPGEDGPAEQERRHLRTDPGHDESAPCPLRTQCA